MKKIALPFLLLLFCVSLNIFAEDKTPIHTAKNIAHRGFSATAPENTLIAMKMGIEAGANGCECDVYACKDGQIVLLHDKNLKRTTGLDKSVIDTTFEEIRSLDAGKWKGTAYKGEKIPTLEEYLLLFKDTDCRPVVEIKMEGIEKPVLKEVRKADMLEKTIIIAFSDNVVKNIRKIEPRICVAWLYSEKLSGTAEQNADRLVELITERATEAGTQALDLDHKLLSPKLIKTLKERGFHVWCWTVDDPKRMRELLDWGVESITTNKPDVLDKILKE